MVDNFEFSDVKQVRKTLLITSFVGICFKMLVKNSTGNIEMLGFKIPVDDAQVIPQLIAYVIIFEIVALLIRYSDESFKEKYKKYKRYTEGQSIAQTLIPVDLREDYYLTKIRKILLLILDIYFPVLLGFFAVLKIFLF